MLRNFSKVRRPIPLLHPSTLLLFLPSNTSLQSASPVGVVVSTFYQITNSFKEINLWKNEFTQNYGGWQIKKDTKIHHTTQIPDCYRMPDWVHAVKQVWAQYEFPHNHFSESALLRHHLLTVARHAGWLQRSCLRNQHPFGTNIECYTRQHGTGRIFI